MKTTEQNLFVRSGKFEAEVTNNRKLRSTDCTIETTDRHEASCDLSATVGLLVHYAAYAGAGAGAVPRGPGTRRSINRFDADLPARRLPSIKLSLAHRARHVTYDVRPLDVAWPKVPVKYN